MCVREKEDRRVKREGEFFFTPSRVGRNEKRRLLCSRGRENLKILLLSSSLALCSIVSLCLLHLSSSRTLSTTLSWSSMSLESSEAILFLRYQSKKPKELGCGR